MFRCDRYKPEDYLLLKSWFDARQFPAPDPEIIPGLGLIVSGEKPIAAGFLFKTDGGVAIIAHLISDPASEKAERNEAVKHLLSVLSLMARDFGFKYVSCATNIKSLGVRFEEYGFEKTDENVNHYRREICL